MPRLVERAHDKIRQASRGMPAVMIRQLVGLTKVMAHTGSADQGEVLLEQGEMILRACEESAPEAADRADVRRRYDALRLAHTVAHARIRDLALSRRSRRTLSRWGAGAERVSHLAGRRGLTDLVRSRRSACASTASRYGSAVDHHRREPFAPRRGSAARVAPRLIARRVTTS